MLRAKFLLCFFGLVALMSPLASAATQTITLKPGWNSVWMEIDPADRAPAAVFTGVPVQQVWCYFPKERPVEFIDDPDDGLWNREGWSVFIPSGPEAFLSNLFAIQAHRPYLIKLGGSSNATLTITGEPIVRDLKWKPKSFNLVGFPVDPVVGGGGAGSFFFNQTALKTGAKYKLTTAGTWSALGTADPIRSGEAYWIYANGDSEFNGPLNVSGDLDFGVVKERATLEIANANTWPVTVMVSASGGFPLREHVLDAQGDVDWINFSGSGRAIPAGGVLTLDLGVQRKNVDTDLNELLTVSGGGSQVKLPLRVSKPVGAQLGGGHAGLWVGSVSLNAVAEVNINPEVAKPTPAEFSYRIIIHVNSSGQTKLLKSAITMWKDGLPSTSGLPEVPGKYVLVTDDARIPDFKGTDLKDGRQFAKRISSAAYDFTGNELALSGNFGGNLAGLLVISKNSPTHPYRHKFHPDHDGLDPQYQPLPAGLKADQEETWEITRDWRLTFQTDVDDGSPGAQYDRARGQFKETITGMHKAPILVTGSFELTRISNITELNPPATP